MQLAPGHHLLELFHGPTLAFKDFAMQLIAQLFQIALTRSGQRITIVGATSGDTGSAAIEAFRNVVLVFHEEFGWLSVDLKLGDNAEEDERRRQVFAFRDALAALGKEELFYRWIEIVQFETSQPNGFGPMPLTHPCPMLTLA